MKLLTALSAIHKKNFIDFVYQVYKPYNAYRDNLSHAAKNFLYKKDLFAKACHVEPLLVFEGSHIVARAMLIHNSRMDALQIGFFEALPEQRKAVDLLLEYAKTWAHENGISRIFIGINGHLTYGVGFLKDHFDQPNAFDVAYTAPYYLDYFEERNLHQYQLTTYSTRNNQFQYPAKLFKKAYNTLTYRCINFKNLKKEMCILGNLFNNILKDTPYYTNKTIEESYELISSIQPLLSNENIIYAMHNNQEIGFIIWHPNFNQLINNNKRQNALVYFLKSRFLKQRVTEYIINTIGVMPKFENTGAAFGLVNEVRKHMPSKNTLVETAFVWDHNHKSRLLCKAMCEKEYRHYAVYEWRL